MDAIENAIRTALEKGDAGSQAFRERVYKSAFSALEKALESRKSISEDMAERRREGLRAKILQIESEFFTVGGKPEIGKRDISGSGTGHNKVVTEAPAINPDDRLVASIVADEPQPGDLSELSFRRRPFAILFISALLLAAIGAGIWWTLQSGILESVEQRDGSVPNPPLELNGESFRPERIPGGDDRSADSKIPRNWIGIFEPVDSTDVTVPGGATAQLTERDGESYLRVGSSGGAEILFDIGEGTLERIAGGSALFSVAARAQEGQTVQMSVACDLAELGDCGRKRYVVGAALAEYLFEVELPDRSPGAAGVIAVNPDITGQGMMVDIKEIRVAITR